MAYTPYTKKTDNQHRENLTELKERVKQKQFSGVYVFYGEEEYTKRYYFGALSQRSNPNVFMRTFFDKDLRADELFSFLDTIPSPDEESMFSENDPTEPDNTDARVIKLVNPDFSAFGTKEEKSLIARLEALPDAVTVVFYFYGAGEESTKVLSKGLMKKVCDTALVVEFAREAAGSAILSKWVARHFKEKHIVIESDVLQYFCTSVGNDMTALQSEAEKLIAYTAYHGRDAVSKGDIDFVCIKNIEAQVFDISNHAVAGNFEPAIAAFQVLRVQKVDPLIIFGTLSKAVYDLCNVAYYAKKSMMVSEIAKVSGLKEYPVKKYLSILSDRERATRGDPYAKTAARLCTRYDELLKSSRTDSYELLEEFIFRLAAGSTF